MVGDGLSFALEGGRTLSVSRSDSVNRFDQCGVLFFFGHRGNTDLRRNGRSPLDGPILALVGLVKCIRWKMEESLIDPHCQAEMIYVRWIIRGLVRIHFRNVQHFCANLRNPSQTSLCMCFP